MAKSMAIIADGVVSNVIWCSDGEPETDTRKNTDDRPIGIGDTYLDGKFYRDGEELLTPLEQAYKELAEAQAALAAAPTVEEIAAAIREGANSI